MARLRKEAPPEWKTRNCWGREAPAVCRREMLGRLFSWAMVDKRDPLRTEKALEEPPSMVGIEEVIMHFMPLLKMC
jgi:hypothetical protein